MGSSASFQLLPTAQSAIVTPYHRYWWRNDLPGTNNYESGCADPKALNYDRCAGDSQPNMCGYDFEPFN